MIGIVESRADEASEHVCEHLRRLGSFEARTDPDRANAEGGGTYHRSDAFELRSFDALHLELDRVADAFDDPDLIVFASRHSGDTGPLLSAHPTGNFGDAEYGGADRSLARAPPNALAAVIEALAEHAPEAYDVSLECTHHGPTDVGAPSMFVELGSGPEQWADPAGAEAVARAILDVAGVAADAPLENDIRRHVVGFGGNHYAPRFTRIARETDWAVGHVVADWSLDELGSPAANADVVEQAFAQSAADCAVVEGSHPALESAIADLDFRIVGETWLRETAGVPLALVETAEDRLVGVEDGLRFGDPVRERGGERATASGYGAGSELTGSGEPASTRLAVVDLPTDLLDVAAGIDREATMAAIDEACVAYETTEAGNRPGDRALVPGDGLPDHDVPQRLLGSLAAILRERFDSITVEADRIVAEETAFDPALAIEAGVPEGPAFGKLSAGEPVAVDGETVAPEDVHERRRVEFPLGGE
ncbi:hypothetical protein L593_04250 [Salinarchaeum sp. Harcht-Bsk1]|uniref:D-aminoacyl-tRNA deacylase n=1 Tax=Salinarchaeum sp. Harcht-Bsk1 TaxID=1333523 RepID=UPI0003423212|nr:D-aminoacyl-tRNA deacylase [Salinarchaeum sp. Harcht-Bsk1]AGN00801.1 hypothetical protein L593_04250 [Salinarchaeum sp. Harcht-Bsk1]